MLSVPMSEYVLRDCCTLRTSSLSSLAQTTFARLLCHSPPYFGVCWISLHSSITLEPAVLHTVRVDTRRSASGKLTVSRALATVKVDIFEVERVDVARKISEEGQADVDEEVGTTACDHKHTHGRQENGDEDDEEC